MGTDRDRLVIPDADPVREYSIEEQRRLTENLLVLLKSIAEGKYSSNRVSPDSIASLHRALFMGVRDHAGKVRSPGFGSEVLRFGPHYSLHRNEVPAKLRAICEEAERMVRSVEESPEAPEYERSAIQIAVWCHAKIIRIHPFEDGNGRTSRALMSMVLVRVGLRPIPAEFPKQEYYAVLNHYFETDQLEPLTNLFIGVYPAV